jgi:hypothetical protein
MPRGAGRRRALNQDDMLGECRTRSTSVEEENDEDEDTDEE